MPGYIKSRRGNASTAQCSFPNGKAFDGCRIALDPTTALSVTCQINDISTNHEQLAFWFALRSHF